VPDFAFRLQRVLEYRELAEGWAKDAYLEARAARLEAVAVLEAIQLKRNDIVQKPATKIEDRIALESCLEKSKEDERQQRIVIELLENDEAKRKEEWTETRKELQALEKLRESAFAQWKLEENRREQKALDELSIQRRAA
jgi:flagellar FliJ protein